MNTIYSDYKSALQSISRKNPSFEQLKAISPHLNEEEVGNAFDITSNTSVFVAIPPTKVKKGFLVASLTKSSESSDTWVSIYGSRTRASYADGKSRGDVFCNTRHSDKAIAFAEENWPQETLLDSWVDFGTIYLDDPTLLNECDYPKTRKAIYWGVSQSWNDINNNGNRPASELINDALAIVTTNRFEGSEIKGGRGGYTAWNCANCGAGLGLSGCANCKHSFKDNHFRSGWQTPLPRKIITLLQKEGFQFGMDPMVAVQKEVERFNKRRL